MAYETGEARHLLRDIPGSSLRPGAPVANGRCTLGGIIPHLDELCARLVKAGGGAHQLADHLDSPMAEKDGGPAAPSRPGELGRIFDQLDVLEQAVCHVERGFARIADVVG